MLHQVNPESIPIDTRGVPGADGYPWWSDAVGYLVWGLIYLSYLFTGFHK
jgi:hypothetical protein